MLVANDGTRLQAQVSRPGEARNESAVSEATLQETEARVMRAALAATGGNVSRAARQLGIHRSTLYRRMRDDEI